VIWERMAERGLNDRESLLLLFLRCSGALDLPKRDFCLTPCTRAGMHQLHFLPWKLIVGFNGYSGSACLGQLHVLVPQGWSGSFPPRL
jgi:hypothetical protein